MRSLLARSAAISAMASVWLVVSSKGKKASAALRNLPSPAVAWPASVRL